MKNKTMKFGVLGCGFWSRFQISAWRELEGVEVVALYNRTRSKAEKLAAEFHIPKVYDTPEELIADPELDFVDIITAPATHADFVHLAAKHKMPVICQKPMASSYEEGKGMVEACAEAGVPFMVHENFRWQAPIRRAKELLDEGVIGKPFRGNISFCSGFPVFDNQPALAQLERFILTDMGTHILDLARFFFGEAQGLYCQTHKVHKNIKGEDVASVMMKMDDATCFVQLSFASILEKDPFPETLVFIEGEDGSLEVQSNYWIRITNREETRSFRAPPTRYSWADPDYDIVHASIVPTNANWLESLRNNREPETSGMDNLKTLKLVYEAYESAGESRITRMDE